MITFKHRLSHWVYALLLYFPDFRRIGIYFRGITRVRAIVLNWQPNKKLGKGVSVWHHCRIPASAKITIGDHCTIKEKVAISGEFSLGSHSIVLANTVIDASGQVWVGAQTHIGRDNKIFSHNHDTSSRSIPVLQAPEYYEPVIIGDDVMLFSQVAIMPGVTIGTGAVVAFGSVVTQDLDEYGIYAGIPARQIGSRQ